MSQFTTAMDIGKRVIEAAEAMGGPMTEAQSEYLITCCSSRRGIRSSTWRVCSSGLLRIA